jgi:hypothetical protein
MYRKDKAFGVLGASLALVLAALAGCAQPSEVSTYEQDRQHCLGVMYADRATRGRSAANWLQYDYCMKQRGREPT